MKTSFLDFTNLIRSIQRAEGNFDCFRRAEKDCNRSNCTWRKFCVSEKDYPYFNLEEKTSEHEINV